jgi:hypothetical protein
MSDKLGSTPAFTVTTTEVRDEVKAGGASERVSVMRETTIRRPDRLYPRKGVSCRFVPWRQCQRRTNRQRWQRPFTLEPQILSISQ